MRFTLTVIALFLSVSLAFSEKNPLYEGFSFIEKGEYQRAFSTFSSVKGDVPERFAGMGISKYMQKDYANAVVYLKTALKSKKESEKWVTNYFTALSLFELKRYEEAIPYFEMVVRKKKLPEAVFKMAICLEMTGDLDSAKRLLDLALELDPKMLDAYLEISNLYIKQNKLAEAWSVVDKALSLFPDNPKLMYQRAKLLFISGKIDEAEKQLELAMKNEKDAGMLSLYSSITNSKKATKKEVAEKPLPKTESPQFLYFQENKYFLISLVFICLGLIIFSGFYHHRKGLAEKLVYLEELLKKNDVVGAEEILNQIADVMPKKVPLLAAKLYVLKNDFDTAYKNCNNIPDNDKRLLMEGLIYCYFGKKEELKKQIAVVESAGLVKHVELLKLSSFEDKKDVLSKILEL